MEDFIDDEETIKSTESKAKKKFDNKVFKFLRVFPKDELIAVRRFIISPYYNESQSVVDLFQYVRRYHEGGYTSRRLVNEVVFNHLFPEETYHHQKLINLYSDLAVLLEKYIAVKELETDKMTRHKVLIDAYGKRRQFDFFEKQIEKGMKEVNKQKKHNTQYYKDRILLNSIMFEYPSFNQIKESRNKIISLLSDTNEYFYLMKLRFTTALINETRLYNSESIDQHKYLQELDILIELFSNTKNKLIVFYEKLLKLQRETFKIDNFSEARIFFSEHHYLFEKEEKRVVYIYLSNIVIIQTNRKGLNAKHFFELQKIGVEQDILIENGYISYRSFLNIVASGASIQEFDWLEWFIKNKSKYLSEEVSEVTITIAKSSIEYYKGNFAKSLELLSKDSKSTFLLELRTRILRIRNLMELLIDGDLDCYYELSYHASLDIKLLKRQKVLNRTRKDGYVEFFRIAKQIAITARNTHMFLSKKQQINEVNRIKRIRTRLNEKKYIAYQVWLKNKLKKIAE